MKKQLISLLLAIVMVCSIMPSAFAASDKATQAAEALYELGLFKGTGTNADGTPIYDLDKTPTRNQAIIMLIRLLGKEEEALEGTWSIPFTDVTDNMKPYIGYAYTNGLTNGYSATTYCGTNPIKANQYIAFVLRALGYESGVEFEVATSYTLSDALGITNGEYSGTSTFTRGDVAIISNSALAAKLKGQDKVLKETLNLQNKDQNNEQKADQNNENEQTASPLDDCYAGTKIKTVTAVTGAKCTGSYTNVLDLYPVSKEYVAGCKHYIYDFYFKDEPNSRKTYFEPYIAYLDSVGTCLNKSASSIGSPDSLHIMGSDYDYYVGGKKISVSYNTSNTTYRAWISVAFF